MRLGPVRIDHLRGAVLLLRQGQTRAVARAPGLGGHRQQRRQRLQAHGQLRIAQQVHGSRQPLLGWQGTRRSTRGHAHQRIRIARGQLHDLWGDGITRLPGEQFERGGAHDRGLLRVERERGQTLRRARLARAPESAELWHALGLLLVRGERAEEALEALSRAAALEDDSRYTYVYGVALYSTGRSRDAIPVLERGHRRHPGDPDLLFALATMHRDLGDLDSARIFAAKLVRILPGDQRAAGLAVELTASP